MKRTASSRRWLKEHEEDDFVARAKAEGVRARSAYKLEWIQKKDKIIKPGNRVVDLGAAPGGWSVMAAEWVGDKGHVYALDCLEITPINNVSIIQGDFTEEAILNQLTDALAGNRVDVVLSDLAPNMSGNKAVDQAKSMYLVELALDFAITWLRPGGRFLVKVFQGEGFETYHKTLKQHFKSVVTRKPPASRARSSEIYLFASDYTI